MKIEIIYREFIYFDIIQQTVKQFAYKNLNKKLINGI